MRSRERKKWKHYSHSSFRFTIFHISFIVFSSNANRSPWHRCLTASGESKCLYANSNNYKWDCVIRTQVCIWCKTFIWFEKISQINCLFLLIWLKSLYMTCPLAFCKKCITKWKSAHRQSVHSPTASNVESKWIRYNNLILIFIFFHTDFTKLREGRSYSWWNFWWAPK